MQYLDKFNSLLGQPMARFMQTSSTNRVQRTFMVQDAKNSPNEVTQSPTSSTRPPSRMPGGPTCAPTALDKQFLLWSGKYKSASEIPKQLEADVIYRARSYGRIRINIGFLFLAGALGGLMVYLGKRAAGRGENVQDQNLEWHRKNKEEYQEEQRNKPK